MRVALRMAFEGSMALALLTATLYCTLRSIASRRATAIVEPAEPPRAGSTGVRRPVFLSRGNLL